MKFIVHATLLALLLPVATFAAVKVDTPTHKETLFEDGDLAPFAACTTENPAYVHPFTLDGAKCAKFYWTEKGYDGTRMHRGAELCGAPAIYKEGWMGFKLYLPSPGFPTDKNQGIAQVFANGGKCSSWTAMLGVQNNQLVLTRRSACVAPIRVVIAKDVRRNAWVPIIIHFVISHKNAGVIEVWYADDATGSSAPTPTYRAANINLAWGQWLADSDSLDPSITRNTIGLKVGMYNYDYGNYTPGESRIMYVDNLSEYSGDSAEGWRTVNPNNK